MRLPFPTTERRARGAKPANPTNLKSQLTALEVSKRFKPLLASRPRLDITVDVELPACRPSSLSPPVRL